MLYGEVENFGKSNCESGHKKTSNRRNNLRIIGMDTAREATEQTVMDMFNNNMGAGIQIDLIDLCHHIDAGGGGKSSIIVKFTSYRFN